MLSREFPRLGVCRCRHPGLRRLVGTLLKTPEAERPAPLAAALAMVAKELGPDWARIAADPKGAVARLAPLKEPLLQLCAAYLLQRGDRSEPAQDPVARFHLNNGARLERVNWSADVSKKGLRESLGMMVNYLYVPRDIESNHEKFIGGEIAASRRVRSTVPRD